MTLLETIVLTSAVAFLIVWCACAAGGDADRFTESLREDRERDCWDWPERSS